MTKTYLEAFARLEKEHSRNGAGWFLPKRKKAIDEFERLGFPTTKDEAWRKNR